MNGAREYARLFPTDQYGKLYIVSASHARGRTFHIYILPENELVKPNGPYNPPLNQNAIEVYGIIAGQPGWTEEYGWLYKGKWQNDFFELVKEAETKQQNMIDEQKKQTERRKQEEKSHIQKLLQEY